MSLLTCHYQDLYLVKKVNGLIRDNFGKRLHPKIWANFDPFTDCTKNPVTCVLLWSNGGTSHVVTFFNNKIFDANLPYAMDICLQALNWCVSSDERDLRYDKCVLCYSFIINRNKIEYYQGSKRSGTMWMSSYIYGKNIYLFFINPIPLFTYHTSLSCCTYIKIHFSDRIWNI